MRINQSEVSANDIHPVRYQISMRWSKVLGIHGVDGCRPSEWCSMILTYVFLEESSRIDTIGFMSHFTLLDSDGDEVRRREKLHFRFQGSDEFGSAAMMPPLRD